MSQLQIVTTNSDSSDQKGSNNHNGRYVALIRQSSNTFLFSDPVFIPDGKPLPTLAEGLKYLFIHPSHVPSTKHTLQDCVPQDAFLSDTEDSIAINNSLQDPVQIPLEADYGMFSSFMPVCDSTLANAQQDDMSTILTNLNDISDRPEQTIGDIDEALRLVDSVLSNKDSVSIPNSTALASETLREFGISEKFIDTLESSNTLHMDQAVASNVTPDLLLEENGKLLAKLVEFQDIRAKSGKYNIISDEEKKVATQLQRNMAWIIGAHNPLDFRPSSKELQNISNQLLEPKHVYSGTLPPQRRFAFISNASAQVAFPSSATIVPMERTQPKV